MRSSANLCAYSDMPSFLSQSAIWCMAVTRDPVGTSPSFPPREQGVYTDKPAISRAALERASGQSANARRVAPLATLGLLELLGLKRADAGGQT